ncbi:glutathione S-transferase family protein [Janthinobacterium sp. 17J80-10]|uniref:glutathione S-transferase family protein n=1 Tax=Janthinobacterium sp. 17J80-10 TaxID=2497863 RepID=UPI00321FCB30
MSPFVSKTEMLLKIAALPYDTNLRGFAKAPKGKLPYIEDDGTVIADSTFIRWHIEKKYGIDFDAGLTEQERGIAWCAEKLLEDNLYWILLEWRWLNAVNFGRTADLLFKKIPWPARPAIEAVVQHKMRKALHAQGTGRHNPDEKLVLAKKSLESLSALLGNKPYLMGAKPCGADATLFAFMAGVFCPQFDTPLSRDAAHYANLAHYVERMRREYLDGGLQAAA